MKVLNPSCSKNLINRTALNNRPIIKMKLPFDTVLLKSEKILKRVLLSGNSEDDYYDKYISFLNACGWENEEFDKELLKRVDDEFVNMWRRAIAN